MSDDTMTRNDDRNAIVMVRHSYSSCRGRLSEFFRNFAVSPCLSVRNLQQLTPDGQLKRRSAKIQRKIELCSSPLEVFLNLPDVNFVRSCVNHSVMWNLGSKMDRN